MCNFAEYCDVKYCFKSNYSDRNLEILDRQTIDNNQEHRPITFELNLKVVTLCDGESLPVST